MTKRPARTSAEWTTFVVAVVILLAVIAAIVAEALRHHDPAQPVATHERTERVGGDFHVIVLLENRGDKPAEAVQVAASLEVDGETTEADQVVDFLAGDDEEELVFVFGDDPDEGKLTVEVTGFTVP